MISFPKRWQFDRLKDVAAINVSSLSSTTDPAYEFDYLEISNVDYHGIVDQSAIERLRYDDAPSRARRRASADSIVISSVRPNLQAAAFLAEVPADFVCSTGFNVVQPRQFILWPRFAYYVLISEASRQYFESVAIGVGYPAVRDKDFATIVIPLPPVIEQQRIAAYLDMSCAALDAAIVAKRQQLRSLDALRKSSIHQIMSEGLRRGRPLKESGIETIGAIPDHWDVKRLRYACEVNYGITLQLEQGQSVGDGVRILTVSNITIDGNLDLEDEYYIDPSQLAPDDYLKHGDLLFNWRNGSQYHVGKTAYFDQGGEFAHVSFLLRIRCSSKMDPLFLRSYLGVLQDGGFFSGAKDKVNKTFNSTELKRLRVIIPPRDEQIQIRDAIEKRKKEINDIIFSIKSQIETLTSYRKSLIYECVVGQMRIAEKQSRHFEANG